MISQAIALAIVTFAGFAILYAKMPAKVRRFIESYPLLSDALAAGATYAFLGGTLTALFAGGCVALMTSTGLHIANHKEDFQYLWDGADATRAALRKVKEMLNKLGKSYRQNKIAISYSR